MKKGILIALAFLALIGSIAYAITEYPVAEKTFYDTGNNDYQITVQVENGWQLIQGFHPYSIIAGSQIKESNIKAVYMYIPDMNKYVEIYPDQKLDNEGVDQSDNYYDDNAGLYSFWVYIDNVGTQNKLIYKVHINDLNNIEMKKGWNFVGMNPKFIGRSINQLKGECIIEKVYYWSAPAKRWFEFSTSEIISDEYLSRGLVIKVNGACSFSDSRIISPPPAIPN